MCKIMRIAVLLTVFNRKVTTLSCLNNLTKQTGLENVRLDVYLTDDGCTDGTPEAVREQYPEAHIIKGDGTLYWNRGMIAAWTEAEKGDYDYYLLLNDDTILNPDALSRFIVTSNTHVDKAIIVGSCHSSDDITIQTYGARDKNFNLIHPDLAGNVKPVTFNANAVLIPRYVYQKLGTLDPIFHHSLGDFDYGLRAYKIGIEMVVSPGFIGECDTHPTIDKWADPTKSLSERWSHFMSPTGANPFEFFKFKRRHKGIVAACLTFCSNFVHVLFPSIWICKQRS